jgi:hypothetical protein
MPSLIAVSVMMTIKGTAPSAAFEAPKIEKIYHAEVKQVKEIESGEGIDIH